MKGWQRWQSSNEMTHPRNVSAHLKTDDLDLDVKSLNHAFASLTSESGSVLLIDSLVFLFKTVKYFPESIDYEYTLSNAP